MRRSARTGLSVLCLSFGVGITACSSLGPHQDQSTSATVVPGIAQLVAQATATPGPVAPVTTATPSPTAPSAVAPTPLDVSHIPVKNIRITPGPIIGTPVTIGPIRLVPAGIEPGTLPHAPVATFPTASATPIFDQQTLRTLPLFHEPTWLPPGFALRQIAETGEARPGVSVESVYSSPHWSIYITTTYLYHMPLDVMLESPASVFTTELSTLNGYPAIFTYPKNPSQDPGPASVAIVYHDMTISVSTSYVGPNPPGGPTFEDLKHIASSIPLP